MFFTYCSQVGLDVPGDFIQHSVQGMQQLSATGKTNFLYSLAKGLGTSMPDREDSVFLSKQLIAGLFEYSANIFISVHKSQVHTYIHTYIVCYIQGTFPLFRLPLQQSIDYGWSRCTHYLARSA